jgi:arabinogalactan oligomer / maltooligosaccharide transport system permease protein
MSEVNRMSPRRWARELGWRHLVALIGVAFSLYPVVWILSAAFNSVDNLQTARLIPADVTIANFKELFESTLYPVDTWLLNTWKVALVASALNVSLASLAAFAFSRLRFRGRRLGLLSLLLIQVFPQFLGFIALFILGQQIGEVAPAVGLGTHIYLITVYMGGAIGFNAFLLKGFMDTIPNSLDESAQVDGASPFQIFLRVVLPLTRPALGVIFILSFIGLFAEVILASFLIRETQQFTLAVGLNLFVQSDYTARWGPLAAAAVLGAGPIVLTFLLAQKQLVGGLTAGAVKG